MSSLSVFSGMGGLTGGLFGLGAGLFGSWAALIFLSFIILSPLTSRIYGKHSIKTKRKSTAYHNYFTIHPAQVAIFNE
jgi:hypothetical protein